MTGGPAYPGKRWMDVAGSLVGLVLTLPLTVLIALAIKLEDRGPGLYVQERLGCGGEPFRLLKFRSMVGGPTAWRGVSHPARGRANHTGRKHPPSVQPGRTAQLVNVLRGEMSLVGPRPALLRDLERYSEGDRRRLDVKPGITGLAQISGRASIPWRERISTISTTSIVPASSWTSRSSRPRWPVCLPSATCTPRRTPGLRTRPGTAVRTPTVTPVAEAPRSPAEDVVRQANEALLVLEDRLTSGFEGPGRPVTFILGPPRTGTTLISQLLADRGGFAYVSNFLARFWLAPYVGSRLEQEVGVREVRPRSTYRSRSGATRGPAEPHEFTFFWNRWFELGQVTQKLGPAELERVDAAGLARSVGALEAAWERPVVFKNSFWCNFQVAFWPTCSRARCSCAAGGRRSGPPSPSRSAARRCSGRGSAGGP